MSGISTKQRSWRHTLCLAALLTTAAVTLWMVGFAIIAGIVEEVFSEQEPRFITQQFLFRDDGLPIWKTTDRRKGWEWAEYHNLDGEPVEMTVKDEHPQLVTLVDSRVWRRPRRQSWKSRVVAVDEQSVPNHPGTSTWFFRDNGRRGFLVAMNNVTKREVAYFGIKGFTTTIPSEEDWFTTFDGGEHLDIDGPDHYRSWNVGFPYSQQHVDASTHELAYAPLFVEPTGRRVFAIDFLHRTIRVVHEGEPVLSANPIRMRKKGTPQQVVLRLRDSLRIVELTNDGVGATEVIPIPENLQRAAGLQWVKAANGHVLVTLQSGGWHLTTLDADHRVVGERQVAYQHGQTQPPAASEITLFLLVTQSPVLVDFVVWISTREGSHTQAIDTSRVREFGLEWPTSRDMEFSEATVPLAILQLSAVLWSVMAVRRLRKFSASRQDQWFWGAWTLLFGAPGYLAFRVHREWRTVGVSPLVTSMRPSKLDETAEATRRLTPPVRAKRHLVTALASVYGKCLDAGEDLGAGVAARVGFPASHTALVLKECRLAVGAALLACLAYTVVVARLVGLKGFGMLSDFVTQTSATPFIHDGFLGPFGTVGFLLAAGLAIWQSVAESRGEAWLFMLSRPVSRRAVLMSKLLIGLLVVTVCTALPIIVYAAWASRPGSVAAPFEWGMTEIAWRYWAALTSIYLATLLTMLRPVRWLGTRLLPVIAAIGWLPVREALGVWCWPVWWELLAVLVINVCLVSSLLLTVREREYP